MNLLEPQLAAGTAELRSQRAEIGTSERLGQQGNRRGPGNAGLLAVVRHVAQHGVRIAAATGVERWREVRTRRRPVRPSPFTDTRGRPGRVAVGVAIGARVGRADGLGQIGTRYAKAVVATVVDDHVGARPHVAVDAAGLLGLMACVVFRGECRRHVTLGTDLVGSGPGHELVRMRVVAVGAGHARAIHAALQERAVHVHLVENLPVREIEPVLEQRRHMGMGQRLTVLVVGRDDAATRVAAPARFGLKLRLLGRFAEGGDPGLRVHDPGRLAAVVEIDLEAVRGGFDARTRLLYVGRARPVARLAAHADLRVGRVERMGGRVEAHIHVRRMALGTHVVPVLLRTGPVQRVVGCDVLVGVQMKPALSSLGLCPGIP